MGPTITSRVMMSRTGLKRTGTTGLTHSQTTQQTVRNETKQNKTKTIRPIKKNPKKPDIPPSSSPSLTQILVSEMEAFDIAVCFDDKILDFGSDVGEKEEDEDEQNNNFANLKHNHDFPEIAEEELEWLSNKDAFPAVDTSFVDILGFTAKQQSPMSVLDNSNSSGSTILTTGNVVMCWVDKFKVPVKARSKRVRRCRDMRNQENRWWVKENVKSLRSRNIGRKCQHCGAEKTPQWRAGPFGPKTLCNACGVRYKSGRLVPEYRPASSPTFSDELHSNSHRKILEMRRQKHLGFSAINPMDKG